MTKEKPLPRGVFREPSAFDGHSTYQVVSSSGQTIARLDVANGCPCTSLIDGLWALLDNVDPLPGPQPRLLQIHAGDGQHGIVTSERAAVRLVLLPPDPPAE